MGQASGRQGAPELHCRGLSVRAADQTPILAEGQSVTQWALHMEG